MVCWINFNNCWKLGIRYSNLLVMVTFRQILEYLSGSVQICTDSHRNFFKTSIERRVYLVEHYLINKYINFKLYLRLVNCRQILEYLSSAQHGILYCVIESIVDSFNCGFKKPFFHCYGQKVNRESFRISFEEESLIGFQISSFAPILDLILNTNFQNKLGLGGITQAKNNEREVRFVIFYNLQVLGYSSISKSYKFHSIPVSSEKRSLYTPGFLPYKNRSIMLCHTHSIIPC